MSTNASPMRTARDLQSVSMVALSIASGVSVAHLYNIEAGRSFPSLDVARRIASALKTTVDLLWPTNGKPEFMAPIDFTGDAA